MSFCPNCGASVVSGNFCSSCGTPVNTGSQSIQNTVYQQSATQQSVTPVDDSGSIGYGFLGFFVPILGLILYLLWKDEKPKTAKRALHGMIASIVSGIVLTVLFFVLIFLIMAFAQ